MWTLEGEFGTTEGTADQALQERHCLTEAWKEEEKRVKKTVLKVK